MRTTPQAKIDKMVERGRRMMSRGSALLNHAAHLTMLKNGTESRLNGLNTKFEQDTGFCVCKKPARAMNSQTGKNEGYCCNCGRIIKK